MATRVIGYGASAVGLDLWALVTESGERRLEQSQQRLDRMLTMRSQRSEKTIERYERQGGRNREFPTTITPLKGDVAHRSERMALFILIVLGEGIVQLTVAAEASEHWNSEPVRRGHRRVFSRVHTVLRRRRARHRRPRAAARQCPVSETAVGGTPCRRDVARDLVAALGQLLEDPSEPVSTHTAWMLALGVSVYGLVSAGAHLLAGGPKRWSIAVSLAVPLVAAGQSSSLARVDDARARSAGYSRCRRRRGRVRGANHPRPPPGQTKKTRISRSFSWATRIRTSTNCTRNSRAASYTIAQ